jgi:hypothetical protein
MSVTFRQLLAALAIAVVLPAAAGADERYGYVRTLQGGASIASTESSAQAAEVNQPVMTGDRVLVSDRSRIELELSDRTLARLDGGSDLTLVRSAFSADAQDRTTLLRLDVGDLQLQVTEDALGDELARIDTANATFYVSEPGLYRVRTDGDGWTEVTVRSGALDVRTETESITLAAGRSLRVDGAEFPRLAEFDTPAEDDFDLWGRELDGQVEQADLRYVEPEMRYTTSSLDRYGDWVNVGSRYAWHPGSVGADWRPYWDGRWGYTPSGLTWISNEPWGWSTYHYGSWDYAPVYGWVWYPGVQYSPAWVYWYWGPSYAAWCPSGYYSRYYGAYGYRYGVYGWAGGGWDGFANWSFVPTRYFGHRNLRDYSHPGAYYRDRYGLRDVPRGIITTDTRPITPNRWDRPTEVIDALQRVRFDDGDRLARRIPDDLPDVSSFVSRRGDLDPTVGRRIAGLPPATDVGVARRIPKDGGDVVQRMPPTDGVSTPAKPRFESPQGAGPRRIGVPRENDASPRGGGPTVEAAPRTQPRVSAQPRTVVPDGGEVPSDIRPRRLPPSEPSVSNGNRQGWRQTQPGSQPRTYVPHEAGQPRPGAQPRAYVPEKGGQPQDLRRVYAQQAPRGSGGPSTDTPVVRRVIDGVRNVQPRPTPYVSPAPQAQPRYQAQPGRGPSQPAASPAARGGENGRARGSGSGSHSREAAPRDNGHGQDKHAEDRKPPQRDHDR